MTGDLLQTIQALQFTDKERAEGLLRTLITELFSLDIVSVELRPLAVSLNSFNGFFTLSDGQRLFFKTHTEPDSVIGEYYNSAILAEAGYPVIKPVYSSTENGRQLLVYEVIEDPSVFDVAWAVESGSRSDFTLLAEAQAQADKSLMECYRNSLAWQSAEDASKAKVHQLFYHRLTGGRLEQFYGEDKKFFMLGESHPARVIRQMRWIINGQHYDETLDQLILQAKQTLYPAQPGPSVIGHGDAHNGNVFLIERTGSLVYFDPAFAGRHHPLLDLTKPLFHNVFAMWMYFPSEKAKDLRILWQERGGQIEVEYDYQLHSVREMFLRSKIENVLVPVLQELAHRSWLRSDWRRYLKSALFCCPFLTMNLSDATRFPPAISLLGLCMSIEMGAESHHHRSYIDQLLDEVANQI
jgi:hypothetical protein